MSEEMKDTSGSCALIVLFVGNDIYIANVGDCRAVLSEFNGNKVTNLSTDHKPNDER